MDKTLAVIMVDMWKNAAGRGMRFLTDRNLSGSAESIENISNISPWAAVVPAGRMGIPAAALLQ